MATPALPPTPQPRPTRTTGTGSTGANPRPTPSQPDLPLMQATPTLAPVDATLRMQIFEEVWTLVRDKYVYEDYGGADWAQVRQEFAPQVAATDDPEQFYALMRTLIGRLGDDHSRFESPQEVAEQQAEFSGDLRYGGIGAQIRTVDEGGLITVLASGGPAEQAGLQPRDLVLAINGIPFNNSEAFGPGGPISAVRGEPGTPVTLTVQRASDPPQDVVVLRGPIDTDAFNEVRWRLLADGTVGLIEIPSFYVDGLEDNVRYAVEQLLASGDLQGLVLDVRENSGGYVHLMRNTIALFHNGGSIGSTSGRSEQEEQQIPTDQVIAGVENLPLVVLISPETVSAAEMFAAGMQSLGRTRVVGMPSAGNTENLYSYSFDDGSRLLIAEVAYRLPDGTLIEGRGVLPDRQVDAEWWRFPPDEDPQLLAALEELGLSQGS